VRISLCPTSLHKARLLEELDEALIENVLIKESALNISKIFRYLDTNDQATIISMFQENKQKEILTKIEIDDKEEVEEIMSYPDDSAGSIMTKETFTLNQNTTVKESIKKLQSFPENDKIFYLYALNDQDKLVGVVSLRTLVTSSNNKKLKDVMIIRERLQFFNAFFNGSVLIECKCFFCHNATSTVVRIRHYFFYFFFVINLNFCKNLILLTFLKHANNCSLIVGI
jgi:Mg/Co/Ni transporter MgtE